ncbi:hypothetical protein NMG60_11029880 [Bertholletia excelsa]
MSNKKLMRYLAKPFYLSLCSSRLRPFAIPLLAEALNSCFPDTPPSSLFRFHKSHSNPILRRGYSSISSTGSPSFCYVMSPIVQPLKYFSNCRYCSTLECPSLCLGLLRPHCQLRLLSVSSSDKNSVVENVVPVGSVGEFGSSITPTRISTIVEAIRSGENDLESKLNTMDVCLSVESLNGIFRVLNCEKISALRFFVWARTKNPHLRNNADVCSLIIDNCGWLNDYETMLCLLKDFKIKKICLREKAFGFLPALGSSKELMVESIRKVVEVLEGAGGSCHNTGIHGLLKMLSKHDLFDMAKFVIEITERKDLSNYKILVLEQCKKRCFREASDLLKEMAQSGCYPDAKIYNYVLSALCSDVRINEASELLLEMKEKGCRPDALTFEIFIYFSIRIGKLDNAVQFLDEMTSMGLVPRLSTHAAFIKGFFNSNLYEEAYNYAADAAAKYKQSGNAIYSLLANLHRKKGDLLGAGNILMEMMEKGFIPSHLVYIKILKRLFISGQKKLASDLKIRFFQLKSGSTVVTL